MQGDVVETPKRRFGRRAKLALLFATLLLFLLIDFAAAQVYRAIRGRPWPAWNPERYYRIPAATYHHDLLPNYSTDTARWGGHFKLRTNSLGFRDAAVREVALKPAGKRIVVIGDSFTEGVGVSYEHTFAGMLGAALAPEGVEVLNAGVSSYFPAIYYRKTKHLLEKGLKFDELIVAIDLSDAEDEATFELVDDVVRSPSLGERAAEAVKTNSIVVWTMLDELRKLVGEQANPEFGPAPRIDLDGKSDLVIEEWLRSLPGIGTARGNWPHDNRLRKKFEPAVQRMADHMDRLHALLKKRRIALTVLVYPWPDQLIAGDPDCAHVRTWREWCVDRGVAFVDASRWFDIGAPWRRRAEVIADCYISGDVHLTEEGHRRIADALLAARAGR